MTAVTPTLHPTPEGSSASRPPATPSLRDRVRVLVDSARFQWTVIAVIMVNAAVLGLEVMPDWMASHGDATRLVGHITTAIFVVELGLRLFAFRWSFFRGAWNLFDFFVVAISLLPATGPFAVLRVLRAFRVLRLLSAVRSMRVVVNALVATIPGMASIAALLAIVLYIFSVIATQMFGELDPEHFGDLGTSLLSMFQVMTGDDWANVVRPVCEERPAAWLFFILYVVIATYIVLNLFIAVAVEALDRKSDEDVIQEIDEELDASTQVILAEIASLRAEVKELSAGSTRNE